MQYIVRNARRLAKNGSICLDTASGIYVYDSGGEPSEIAGALMRYAIKAHASAVVFTKRTEYYPMLKDADIQNMTVFTPEEMFSGITFPWIAGLSPPAYESMTGVLLEAGLHRSVIYMKGRAGSIPAYAKPGMALSFYQILDKGSKKDRLLSEALFTGLISETAYREEVRETVFFYDAPYHPQTETALKAIRSAHSAGAAFIGVYQDDAENYDSGQYGLTLKGGRVYLRDKDNRRSKTEIAGLL